MSLPLPPALVITDRHQAQRPLEEITAALFGAGCRWLSLREKDLPAGERRVLAQRIVTVGRGYGAVITIHDDLDTAAALGLGVHLPARGSVAAARGRLGADAFIGISAHGADEIAQAAAAGADYATLSPIFATGSKPGYGPALGLGALRGPWKLPVVALGGVVPGNAASCVEAGAAGVAIMGAAMRATDPAAFMSALLERLPGRLAGSAAPAHSR